MNISPDAWKKVETERALARGVFLTIGEDGIDMDFQEFYIESEGEQRARLAHLVKNSIPEELKKTSSSEKIGELQSSVSTLAMNAIIIKNNNLKDFSEQEILLLREKLERINIPLLLPSTQSIKLGFGENSSQYQKCLVYRKRMSKLSHEKLKLLKWISRIGRLYNFEELFELELMVKGLVQESEELHILESEIIEGILG